MNSMHQRLIKLGMALIMLLGLAAVMAGCGGAEAPKQSAPASNEPAGQATHTGTNSEALPQAETGDDQAATQFFTDATGRVVEVPAVPERIASLEFTGYLWALGITPVGTAPRFFNPPFDAFMDGVADLGYPANLEKLAELDPDLIIAADYLTAEQVEAYEKIAPVVLLAWSETNNLNRLTMLANLLNRHEEEQQWLASYQGLVQETRDKLSSVMEPGETASVFYAWGTSINLLAPQVISTLFDDIGFEPTERMKERLSAEPGFASETISQEVLPEYAADRMFIIAEGELGKSLLEELKGSVLKTLPAFQEGKVYLLHPNWYSFEPGLLEWQLHNAVEVLTE